MNRFIARAAFALALFSFTSAYVSAQISTPSMQETQDRLMIEDLMSRYEWALDTGDADAYGALFAENGVLTSGGARETKGRAAIAQEVRDLSARFRAAQQNGSTARRGRAR